MRAPLLAFAAACALLCGGVYAVAFGSARGRLFDTETFGQAAGTQALARVSQLSADVVRTIDIGSLILLGGGIVLVALLQGRAGVALASAIVIAGANLTTQVLKPTLAYTDPLGGDAQRVFSGGYPSGHATVAMSLAAALVLAAPPSLKLPAAVVGAAYAALIGVSLLIQRWHYASDVAGGYFIASAWAGLVAALLRPRPRIAPVSSVRRGTALAILLVAAFMTIIAVTSWRHPYLLVHFEMRKHLLSAAVALALVALAVTLAFAALLERAE